MSKAQTAALAKIDAAPNGRYDAAQIKAHVLQAMIDAGLVTGEMYWANGAIKSVDFPVAQIASRAP